MAGYLTAPAHAFFIKCNRKAISRRKRERGPDKEIIQKKEMIRKRKRDGRGKKLP
jgi:hypothetical protein